jgi:hypothetical protein
MAQNVTEAASGGSDGAVMKRARYRSNLSARTPMPTDDPPGRRRWRAIVIARSRALARGPARRACQLPSKSRRSGSAGLFSGRPVCGAERRGLAGAVDLIGEGVAGETLLSDGLVGSPFATCDGRVRDRKSGPAGDAAGFDAHQVARRWSARACRRPRCRGLGLGPGPPNLGVFSW